LCIKKLLDEGVCVTVNSDDPAYFGGYLTENYLAIAKALNLSRDDILTLAKNSIDAAFISDEQKARLTKELIKEA
jgi:adenine deaminase